MSTRDTEFILVLLFIVLSSMQTTVNLFLPHPVYLHMYKLLSPFSSQPSREIISGLLPTGEHFGTEIASLADCHYLKHNLAL